MLKKGKILFLGKLPPPFIGPSVAAQMITESYLKDKYDLIFFDISYHKSLEKFGHSFLKSFFITLKLFYRFIYTIFKYQPDVIYIPSQQDTLGYLRDCVLINISKIFKKKIICHLRGGYFKSWYLSASPLMKWIVRRTHKKIDAQIVLGESLRYLYDFLLPAEKIFVIPNGGNYIFPEANKESGKVSVLFLGNYFRSKGIIDFINAIGLIKTEEHVEYIIAGEASEKEVETEIDQFIKSHGNINVNVIGRVDQPAKLQLLKNSDILVFPTYYPFEGHPWVIVEALAAGLPVISTRHAAIPETVLEEVNGYLVEKQNPIQLAEKMTQLIENKDLRSKMATASRRVYEEKFTGDLMIQKLDHLFSFILDKK